MLRWWIVASLALCTGCFDGRDALGLPCEQDFQCGNDQVCADGVCARPGDAGDTGSGSGTVGSSGASESTGSSTTSSDNTGGPPPTPTCRSVEGMVVAREISVTGSGNPMSVGVGRFSDANDADIAVLTRSPPRLSVFRFDGTAFQLVDDAEVDQQPMDLAVGSLDDDSFDDVVVIDGNAENTSAVTFFWGAAGGLFSDPQTSYDEALPFPQSVDIGQMLEFELPQFLVSSGTLQNASSLFSMTVREATLRFSHSPVSASPWDTVLADLNGGPPLEALVGGSNDQGLDDVPGSDVVHVLAAAAGDGFSVLQELDAAHSPFGVAAGDLDGDGLPEVIVVGKNIERPATVAEKSNNPSEISICSRADLGMPLVCQTWQPGGPHTGYNNIRLADLNNDGALDAVIGTTGDEAVGDGQLLVAMGPLGPDFVPTLLADTGPIGNKLTIADVTGDGALDVMAPLYGVEGSGQGVVCVYSLEEESG